MNPSPVRYRRPATTCGLAQRRKVKVIDPSAMPSRSRRSNCTGGVRPEKGADLVSRRRLQLLPGPLLHQFRPRCKLRNLLGDLGRMEVVVPREHEERYLASTDEVSRDAEDE